MNTTPYFRIALVVLGLLALAMFSLLGNAVHAAEVETRVAPVVTQPDAYGVMKQTGWYRYRKQEDAIVLYCIPESDVLLVCAVFVTTPKGNAVILVDGITASEQRT